MTAGALRPSLFTHLFATERHNPDRGDVAASVISLILHGSIAVGLVWASTAIKPADERIVEEPVSIVIPVPDPQRASPPRGGGPSKGGSPRWTVVPPDLRNLPDPTTAPIEPEPWVEPGEPAAGPPGDAASTDAPAVDTGELRGGFEVLKVLPQMLNKAQVQHALVANYPRILRDSGIGGRVMLWLLIDENGRVVDTEVKESSGHDALDKAAMKVGEVIRFSPGMNRENRVKVWVALPVVFTTR